MASNAKTHVIFDLDGTLLDTERLYTEAAQSVVARFGKTYDWSVKRLVIGGDPHEGARKIVQHLELPISPEQYLSEREQRLRELCRHVQPMPGAVALIAQLVALAVPLGIGTSSQREMCELKLSAQSFASHFSFVCCSDDAGITRGSRHPIFFSQSPLVWVPSPRAASCWKTRPRACARRALRGWTLLRWSTPIYAMKTGAARCTSSRVWSA